MGKTKIKTDNVSGWRIAVMIITILLLSLIMAFSMLLGISSFKRNSPVVIGEDATTVRKALPSDGVSPMSSSPLDNIGYMAYVMDHQPQYHAKAYNSTKSTGYEQVTQTWKDYKNAELSGAGLSVMVCSDLSYSALVKSSTQACFIGDNEAHVRSGGKPGKKSEPQDIDWSANAPSVYDKKGYKYVYGEFSTEISVYVINEQTLIKADDVVDNGDGTYSQKYYLNENAACWYQYKMKTNGGLKIFPRFKKIEITFTFDSKWQVLESYCEDRATINPKALGGMDMESNSKTTTTYDYSAEGFDGEHFAYFDNYFKAYIGSDPGKTEGPEETTVIEILGSGFSKVVGGGQQFNLDITLGETAYDGKVYLSLPDMSDILGTLDARVALEKRGSGRQDLYIEFKKGAVNVYYSTGFALTADIDGMSQSVNNIVNWVNGVTKPAQPEEPVQPAALYAAEAESGGLDISSLLNDLKLDVKDTEAFISLKSENLLNFGIGIDAVIGFDRIKSEDGDTFSAKSIDLNSIKYDGKTLDLKANISPDNDGETITRQAADTPANLKDYLDSVYSILSSKTIKVDLDLADKLIEGLTLNADAYVSIGSDIAAKMDISADYKGISLKLDASYIYDKTGYGKVYLHVSEVNGKAVNAKIYCDIKDTVDTVKDIIELFKGTGSDTPSESVKTELAEIINKVLNLNFEKIIGKVSGNNNSISLDVNVKELLAELDVNLGLNVGELSLTLDREPARLSGSLPALGLGIEISGSENSFETDKENYVDINVYLESVYYLLQKPSYDISVSLVGTKLTDKIDLSSLKVTAVATAAIEDGNIRVALPVTAQYGEYGIKLTAYYTINLSDGTYGKVYLNVAEISVGENVISLDAKAYCDIKHVADGVTDLIAKFTPAPAATEDTGAQEEQASLLARALETLLKLDYNQIITATNENLTVKLNVDEILSGLEISLGGISFGELNLEFTVATGALSGTLENLGLTLGVSGNEEALAPFATDGYVDLGAYLDNISALISKKSYNLELSFAGNTAVSEKIDLTGLSLDVNAQLAFMDNFSGVNVNISKLAVAYNDISLELAAHYNVGFDGGYGKVYLEITKVNGAFVSAKVSLDISNAVSGVKEIINAFKANAAQTYAETNANTDIFANIINGILKLDFNELIEVTAEKAAVKLDLDTLLSEFNLGLNLGTVNLEYVPADFTLSGSDSEIGLNLFKLSGSDDELAPFDSDGYIDLNAFIDGVKGLVNSNVYEIGLKLTGTKLTEKIDLTGLEVNAAAYATVENGYNNITVYVPVKVTYCGLSVELNAYYTADINGGNYTTVYLELTKIDNTALSAKVYCDVQEAIAAVKDIINAFKAESEQGAVSAQAETADIISKVVGIVLNLDYPNIIKGSQNNLSVTLDVDEILSELNISVGGIAFGNLQLDLTLTNGVAALSGEIADLGVSLSLKGNDSYVMPATPVADDYLDITSALKLVKDMIDEGKKIAEAKDIAFTVNGAATIDGVNVSIAGNGEVIWGDTVKAAVALSVAIGGETLDLNVIYDAAVDPFIILAINNEGVKISKGEINNLIDSIKGLVDVFKKTPAPDATPATPASRSIEVGGYSLEEILKNENVKKVLNAVLGIVSDFAVEIQGTEDIYKLILSHVGGATVTLGADGCLSLEFAQAGNNLSAKVEACDGATFNSILENLNTEGNYTYSKLSEFIKKLYNGLFDELEKASLSDLLGNPYTVSVNLTGKNSGISALEGVTVKADLYYDDGVVGTEVNTKLIHAALDMNINGTAVKASVSYRGRTLFIDLQQIGGTTLNGIKFKCDVEDIFDAAEQLVRMVTDTTFVGFVSKLMGKGTVTASEIENLEVFAAQTDETGTPAPSKLTKLIDALLNLNLENSFRLDKDTNTLTVNVDHITEAVLNIKIGTLTATYTDKSTETTIDKSITANVKLENKEAWLTLNAANAVESNKVIINPDDYMDIGFVSTLLTDIVNTVTGGTNTDGKKEVYDLYTFVGSISVNVTNIPVLGNLSINFKNTTLTAGFENDKFYLTLAASMEKTRILIYDVTAARDISITYCDGLIVLGRDIGTKNEIYKVLTLEYLLDNLMDKNNSPVRWLLGTSQNAWGLIADNVKLNIDSGLTKPKTYTLYEQIQHNTKESVFSLSDYLSGVSVNTGEGDTKVYGQEASLAKETFNLTDNYYALDLNAKKLTGGVLSGLCAVITRDADGLSGIKAYGKIDGSIGVNFTLDFNQYLKGEKNVYGGLALKDVTATVTEEEFYNDFAEVEDLTADTFDTNVHYVYNADSDSIEKATAYEEGAHYFVKVNTAHYVKSGDDFVLATEYSSTETYYKYGDSDAKLGTVAVRNYLAYVTDKYGFDKDKKFEATEAHIANHTTPIFGCYNTENNTYETSDVLETVYLDVYTSRDGEKEKTVEVLYGSTVKLVSDFPEFVEGSSTEKLIYENANGENLYNSIVITEAELGRKGLEIDGNGRVSIYKNSVAAIEVTINFVGINNIDPEKAAFVVGDELGDYVLEGYSFLGWYREESLTTRIYEIGQNDAVDGRLNIYGKFIKSLYEDLDTGINYTYDPEIDGYYVSGTNANIANYHTNGKYANEWLEIKSQIGIYDVKYIGANAFANVDNTVESSLVNVLVPETVTAVYEKAFLDNKGLKKVVFFADSVFFAGSMNNTIKNGVFYGCYPGDPSNNNDCTIYYNNTLTKDPKNANITIDKAWNRIYFNKEFIGQTVYTIKTQQGGWAFAEFVTEVPEGVDLSGIIQDGLQFTSYGEASHLANAINDKLTPKDGYYYEVKASVALPLDGKRHYVKITVTENKKAEVTETDIAVTVKYGADVLYDTNPLNGRNPITVKIDANLADIYSGLTFINGFNKNDYVFLGWYTDEALTEGAPTKNNGKITELYAKVMLRTITLDNGVKYEFVEATDQSVAHYVVSGFDTAKGAKYTQDSEWLIIANTVNGYNVTEIKADAFKATNIKNVVVPSNITKVGTMAFANNVDMLNAVFLAGNVHFDGSVTNNMQDSTYAFAGCYITGNSQWTNLTVYYNQISDNGGGKEDNPGWSWFGQGGRNKPRYVGGNDGGYRIDSNWTFAVFATEEYGYKTGVYESDKITTDSIVATVVPQLNATSYKEGFIYGHTVTPVEQVVGGIHNISIEVTETYNSGWHLLTFDGSLYTLTDREGLEDGIVYYENGYFVKPEADVKLSLQDGTKVFTSVTVNEKTTSLSNVQKYTFKMGNDKTTVTFLCKEKPIEKIKLISSVEFTSNVSIEEGYYTLPENTTVTLSSITATNSEYTLIGWAYESGANLAFEETVKHTEYHAIWMKTRAEITETSVSDGVITATSTGSVYGWYTDANFSGTPLATCDENNAATVSLTTSTTKLYARMQYNLVVSVSGNDTVFGYTKLLGGKAADPDDLESRTDLSGDKNSITNSYVDTITGGDFVYDPVLEGYSVTAYRFWENALVVTVLDNNEKTVVTYLLKGRKNNCKFSWEYTWRNELGNDESHYVEFVSGDWKVGTATRVGETNKYYHKYDKAESKYEFGFISKMSSNAKISIAV